MDPFAAKLRGRDEPIATWFKLQDGAHYNHFGYLVHAIEETVRQRQAVYPVERTLLTTGILDRCLHSVARHSETLNTPELARLHYHGREWPFANHPLSRLVLPHDV